MLSRTDSAAASRGDATDESRSPSGWRETYRERAAGSRSYRYRALRTDGGVEAGSVEAPDRESAAGLLAARGVFPFELRAASTVRRGGRVSVTDLALGLRALGTLLDAGLSMHRALHALDELVPPSWRSSLPAVREAVREGRSLARALAGSGLELPPISIGIIEAGDAAGALGPAVRRAAELLEQTHALRSAIRGALAYPLVLAAAGAGAIGLMIGVVLPRFEAILLDLGQPVPASTRLVLVAGDVARMAMVPAGIAAPILALTWRIWTARVEGRRRWHAILLSVPRLGSMRRASATSRIAAALAALLERGVTVSAALTMAGQAGGDACISARIAAARERVLAGERLSRAVAETTALTPTAARLMRAGEDAGSLPAMLEHVARIEGERAERQVRTGVRLLEPVLILVFASLVALVAAALLQAVYSVSPTP